MTMFAVPTTSTKGDRHHAEPTDDGKAAGHAVAGHGRSPENAGARSSDQRTEFPRTTRTCPSSQSCPAVKSTTSSGSRQSRSAITLVAMFDLFRLWLGAVLRLFRTRRRLVLE